MMMMTTTATTTYEEYANFFWPVEHYIYEEKKVVIRSRVCQIGPMGFDIASTNGKAYVNRRRTHVTN